MTAHRSPSALVASLVLCLATAAPRHVAPDIDPAWLHFDATAKSLRFQLIAGLTGANGALNFNGFRDGGLTLTVPAGWQVEIDFRNHDGMLPHSAAIIAPQTPLPVQPVEPAIPRAFTLRLAEGLVSEATDTLRFAAEPPGDYLIYCGVSGHGASGMWIRFRVSASAAVPSLLESPAPAR